MKTLQLGIVLMLVLVAIVYEKSAVADSTGPAKILGMHVLSDTIKVNDAFSIEATILNNSTYPIYLTSGSCTPAFSVAFDSHAKQIYPNISCTAEAMIQKVDPQSQVTVSNAHKPGIIYQAIRPGTATVNITLAYFAKNQTATDYSNISYITSKSFQFLIHDNKTSVQTSPRGGPSFTFDKIPPLRQFKSGIKSEDVKCNNGFILIQKASNNMPACVTQQTYYKLVARGWTILQNTTTTAWVYVSGTQYSIPYIIRGWNNDLSSSMTFDQEHKSLVIPIKSVADKGEITLTVPKPLLDTNLGQDAPFIVLVDGQETKHTETVSATARMLTIPFGFGTQKIEIFAPQRI